MLAPAPKKKKKAYLSSSLFGNKIDFISKTLVLEVHRIGHWNLDPDASAQSSLDPPWLSHPPLLCLSHHLPRLSSPSQASHLH